MDTPSLSIAIKSFMFQKKALGRAPGTIYDYEVNLGRLIDFIGEKDVAEVAPDDLNQFFYWLQNTYVFVPTRNGIRKGTASTTSGGRKLKAKTVKNTYTCVRSFWNWACQEYGIPNPLKLKGIGAKTEPIIPLTEDEIERLLKACDSYLMERNGGVRNVRTARPTKLRDRAIVLTLYDTGVRVSELCGLRFRDLDTDNFRLSVVGKGSKHRYVKIGHLAMQTMWKYVISRFPRGNYHQDDYIFVDRDGLKPLNRHSVRQLLAQIGKRADVKDVHPHRFRHSFGRSLGRLVTAS